MAHKARRGTHERSSSDDDDAPPEVVSGAASKADAKLNQKALHDFEAEEKVRRKARNQERDRKLKERARVTRSEKKLRGPGTKGEDEDQGEDADDVEARMLRAMREAANEMESDFEGEDEDGFKGFGQGMDSGDDIESGSDFSSMQDEDEDGEVAPLQTNMHRSSKGANYLADELFAAAFASQSSKQPAPKKDAEPTLPRTIEKRRRKFSTHPKDLVVGGRTIRTLPSDLHSQAIARSVQSARASRFVEQSLALKGKRAVVKAKKRGWERRPANVGIMKYQGAPHGFARSNTVKR